MSSIKCQIFSTKYNINVSIAEDGHILVALQMPRLFTLPTLTHRISHRISTNYASGPGRPGESSCSICSILATPLITRVIFDQYLHKYFPHAVRPRTHYVFKVIRSKIKDAKTFPAKVRCRLYPIACHLLSIVNYTMYAIVFTAYAYKYM